MLCLAIIAAALSVGSTQEPTKFLARLQGLTPDAGSCFAKVRTSASLNPTFRSQLDELARTARLDHLWQTLEHKMSDMCTSAETKAVATFRQNFDYAMKVTERVMRNLTNGEKDKLNAWANLNDTESERKFFLYKFDQLPPTQLSAVRSALSEVFNLLVDACLKPYQSRFLSEFDQKEMEELKEHITESHTDEFRSLFEKKAKTDNFTPSQVSEMERFLVNAFSNVPTPQGIGSRQYQRKHHHTNNALLHNASI